MGISWDRWRFNGHSIMDINGIEWGYNEIWPPPDCAIGSHGTWEMFDAFGRASDRGIRRHTLKNSKGVWGERCSARFRDVVRNSDISMFLGGYSSTPDFRGQIQAARPDFMCQLHSGSRFMWQSRFLDTNCWWRQKEDMSPRHRIKTAWILCFLPSNICVSKIGYTMIHSGKKWNTKYPWNPHCGYITTRYPHVCG
jgi:hypothetical protein